MEEFAKIAELLSNQIVARDLLADIKSKHKLLSPEDQKVLAPLMAKIDVPINTSNPLSIIERITEIHEEIENIKVNANQNDTKKP